MTARLWLAAGLLAALVAAYGAGRWQQWQADERSHTAALLKATEQARKIEHALQEKADGIRIEGEAARRRIAGELERARDGLRQRAERLPEAARPACAGSTGAELSRRDADAALRLAARADELRAALQACQAWAQAVTEGR
jgi:hypothetical protein